jgi:manganese-dependent inorganic pyrophosphatase
VDGIGGADILEIIDHHRIGSLETMSPVFFRNQPLGCTATIVYQMYQEQNVPVTKEIAGILCSAILSDTLMYRSPTCTPLDKCVAEELAKVAGINTEEHAKAMFQAGSDFSSKTPEEIFYQDFKTFSQNGIDFGVGQISAMTQDELDQVKEKLLPYLPQAMNERKIEMVFVMLTNIIEETTYLICAGEKADELVEHSYHVHKNEDYHILKGVISRKKQLIPVFMSALQEQ